MIYMLLFGSYGRNGNMLFQLSSGLSAAIKNETKVVVPKWIGDEILNIKSNSNYKSIHLPQNRYFKYLCYILPFKNIYEGNDHNKYPLMNNYNNIGYFQSLGYFIDNKNEVLASLEPIGFFKEILYKYKNKVEGKIAIHIRRGDYLNFSDIYPLCDISFYEKAMSFFEGKEFLIFSDDIEWCKENFKGRNFSFSDEIYTKDEIFEFLSFYGKEKLIDEILPWIDLYLMSYSDGNIIANSSYSWWGAYLNNKQNVIYPLNWINLENIKNDFNLINMIPEGWRGC